MPSFTQIPPLSKEISRHAQWVLTDDGRTDEGQPKT